MQGSFRAAIQLRIGDDGAAVFFDGVGGAADLEQGGCVGDDDVALRAPVDHVGRELDLIDEVSGVGVFGDGEL